MSIFCHHSKLSNGIPKNTFAYISLPTISFMSQIQIFDTTIKVKNSTRDRLAKRGTKAHTYDLIIVELLDLVEEKNK